MFWVTEKIARKLSTEHPSQDKKYGEAISMNGDAKYHGTKDQ